MKKIIICLFVFPLMQLFAQVTIFDSLSYYRVTSNYFGSAYNGKSILVYGDGGVIVRSIDGGNKWSQVNLDDSYKIVSITNVNNDFYGLLDHKYLIKSSDDGASWSQYDFGDSTNFYKILANKDNLYFITANKILIYDKNIQFIKEYEFSTDTNYCNFTITGDSLIYKAGKGKLGIIDLNNDYRSLIDFTDLGFCNDCVEETSLLTDGDNTYFTYDFSLYQIKDNKINIAFPSIDSGNYWVLDDIPYEIYADPVIPLLRNDSLYFAKCNNKGSVIERINSNVNDRYLSNLHFNDLKFLTRDTLIAVGDKRLIYMSYDGGRNWTLKSHFDFNHVITRNDGDNAFCLFQYLKLIKTSDGGITWLPQKNYNSKFVSDNYSNLFNGAIRFIFNNELYLYKYTDIQGDINFAYSTNNGDSVILKNVNGMIGQYVDDLITECQIDNKMIISLPAYSPNINLKLNMIYILNDTLGIEGKSQIDSIKINYIDKNNNNELIAIATNYRYYHIVDSHNVWDSIYYSIIYSTDMGVSWQEKGRLNIPYPNHQLKVFIKKNNHIYIADQYYNKDSKESKAIIYSLNLETLLVDSLYSLNNFSIAYSPIFSISGNRAFLNGYDNNPDKKYYDIIINDDIENHPYNWKRIGPINRFNNVGIDAKNDSLITIYAYDSLMHSDVIWLAKPKTNTNVETETETINNLYLSNPVPNPARNYVKTRLYWNIFRDFSNIRVNACDILGNIVADNNAFSIEQINSYSCEITWEINNRTTGVYFINVNINGKKISTPVIIE